ncbi:FAD-dependent oxidoreductase [Massilia yuzhufengensis]|uniref:2-polyprenyl-6-methoxyphenol hydroxylase n=1 Tax=Massilia yuzhufengensis TaxID=1164594 RepID=A0A1I1I5S7_9BURK|nr:FAD-dependent oxidoreductase [Massilia yuzhufengensis]SFC31162.1 2-polyprenyl-6-methoxyphenol hydroxylase [Massilia yuzhufengensis]
MERYDVLIAGAGPTGMVLALALAKQGIRVCIVDKAEGPGTTSRAMAVQARTLELYRPLGLADEVAAAGRKNPAINLWVKGKRRAHLDLQSAGVKMTPYPFVLIYPQDAHERLLERHLEAAGVSIWRRTELADFEERGEQVVARLRRAGGSDVQVEARYLAGCDGARSTVRRQLGTGFAGGTYDHIFYVADVQSRGPAANGEIHLSLETSDFVILLGYDDAGRGRLVGTIQDQHAVNADALSFDDVSHKAMASLGMEVEQVHWFSTYRVHHRVTDHYRRGRAFLLGDAAHVHSPAGGQGMNTGIGDAINLAWKLAAVVRGDAPDSLLDTYEPERIAFARKLVETTDRLFSFVTAEGNFANFVRMHIAPMFASAAYGIGPVREMIFRILSQTTINYHDSPLSSGVAGRVHGGDRLPWVAGLDNYAAPARIDWQVHVYGQAFADLRDWCDRHGMILREFDWGREHDEAGMARNAGYLVRPDGYVALCDPGASAQALEDYFCDLDYRRFRVCQPRQSVL